MSSIAEIMSSPVVVVSPIDTLAHARNLMLRNKINRLIVVDSEAKPIGILTRGDMAREVSTRTPTPAADSFDDVTVQEAMTKSPITLKTDSAVLAACQMMLRKKVSAIPIADDNGALVGIVSKTDLARFYADNCEGFVKISEVETRNVITVPTSYSLYRSEELMHRNRIGRLVVTDASTPIGIITQRDISFTEYPAGSPQEKYRHRREVTSDSHVRSVRLPEGPTVEEAMKTPPITVLEKEDVAEAARLMMKQGIGGLPVVDERGNLTGMITKTDVVKALVIYHSRYGKSASKV